MKRSGNNNSVGRAFWFLAAITLILFFPLFEIVCAISVYLLAWACGASSPAVWAVCVTLAARFLIMTLELAWDWIADARKKEARRERLAKKAEQERRSRETQAQG